MSGIVGGAGSKSGVIGTTEIDYETGSFTPTIEFGGAFRITTLPTRFFTICSP